MVIIVGNPVVTYQRQTCKPMLHSKGNYKDADISPSK